VTETAADAGTVLAVRDLHVSYGRVEAVHGVTLDVRTGEIVAVLGRNGVGKTTLLRGLCGAGVQRRGSVVLTADDGRRIEISSTPTHKLARMGIAWIPDDRRMFAGMSVRHALELTARATRRTRDARETVERIIDSVSLVATLASRDGDRLSGGEQQIVAVARALAMNPRVVLMDEPSEGLAPKIVDELGELIASLAAEFQLTVLLAEQNLEFALELSNRVVMLQTGEIVFDTALDDPGFSRAIVEKHMAI
jgi:branched-chain amino acid transport system ATP-binding protein